MYSLLCAVWAWLTDSANILLDLAIAGRDAKNPLVLAIVATLAVIRIAAFLIFTFPALGWIKNQIWLTTERKRKDEWVKETSVRAFVIIISCLSAKGTNGVMKRRDANASKFCYTIHGKVRQTTEPVEMRGGAV